MLPARVLKAIALAEIPECGCQRFLMPSCLKGQEWGCSDYRLNGACECKMRLLPVCQRDHIGGCDDRRQGKRCSCPVDWMPECLSPGCKRRRAGRICDSRFCSKWPGDPCEHIQKAVTTMLPAIRFLNRFYDIKPRDGEEDWNDEGWAYALVRSDGEEYFPLRMMPAPANLTHRGTRIAILEERAERHEALWNPHDILYPAGEPAPRHLARRIQQFLSLARQK